MPSVAIIGSRGYPSYYGGFETLVRRLAPYLADAGWDVTVYGRPGLKSDDPDRDRRVRSVITPGVESKKFSTLSYGLSASSSAFVKKPDVALVLNCANGYWLPILKARGIPTVVNVDGIEWERGKWGRSARAVFRGGAKLTARFADELVFDAKAIGEYWQQNFGRDGEFIPYGGDPRPELPVEPGLTSGKYVLVVARFVEENTINEFADAAERLAADHDVVFVGSSGYGGEIDQRIERLAAANPRVHWFGHVKDDLRLHSLWQHAGAYFHGHSVGGTNPALVQAMMLGAPIIARDTVYNREVLGGSGLMVAPDAGLIAEAADRLVRSADLRALLGGNAKARAEAAYTWESVCDRYESLLWAYATGRVRERVPAAVHPVHPALPGLPGLPAAAQPEPASAHIDSPVEAR